jgi:hypothetical protein
MPNPAILPYIHLSNSLYFAPRLCRVAALRIRQMQGAPFRSSRTSTAGRPRMKRAGSRSTSAAPPASRRGQVRQIGIDEAACG